MCFEVPHSLNESLTQMAQSSRVVAQEAYPGDAGRLLRGGQWCGDERDRGDKKVPALGAIHPHRSRERPPRRLRLIEGIVGR
jgi:hypothetical protein